jgi:hypothetical protein
MAAIKTRRSTVTLSGRLSFTGSGDALLVLPDDQIALIPDPFGGNETFSPTLDLLAELTKGGRFVDFGDAVLGGPDETTETVDVYITIARRP